MTETDGVPEPLIVIVRVSVLVPVEDSVPVLDRVWVPLCDGVGLELVVCVGVPDSLVVCEAV